MVVGEVGACGLLLVEPDFESLVDQIGVGHQFVGVAEGVADQAYEVGVYSVA